MTQEDFAESFENSFSRTYSLSTNFVPQDLFSLIFDYCSRLNRGHHFVLEWIAFWEVRPQFSYVDMFLHPSGFGFEVFISILIVRFSQMEIFPS